MIEVRQTAAFRGWLADLRDGIAVKAIKRRIARVQVGLFGDAKSVGDGVSELRIDLGPGYRVYFAPARRYRRSAVVLRRQGRPGPRHRAGQGYGARMEGVNHMSLKTFPFDAADAIDTPQERAGLLAEAFASGDAAVVTAALGLIARARGITQVSRETGLSREALYKATSAEGDPTLATLMGIMKATGLKLSATVG